jgi:hypothetical protein
MPVTRRDLIVALTLSPLAAVSSAAELPANADAQLQKAYANIRETSTRLAQIAAPMNLEPAFVFKP